MDAGAGAAGAAQGAGIGAWAGPIGAAIGGGLGLAGGLLQSSAAEDAAQDAYLRQIHWAKKGPGYQMQGLRDAGLNPILAAGKIGGGAGGQPQAQPINPAQNAVKDAAAGSLIASNAKQAAAQAKLFENDAVLSSMKTDQLMSIPLFQQLFVGREMGLDGVELALFMGFANIKELGKALNKALEAFQSSAGNGDGGGKPGPWRNDETLNSFLERNPKKKVYPSHMIGPPTKRGSMGFMPKPRRVSR